MFIVNSSLHIPFSVDANTIQTGKYFHCLFESPDASTDSNVIVTPGNTDKLNLKCIADSGGNKLHYVI